MTTPYERTRALLETKQFLYELRDPKLMPRVTAAVRKLAGKLLQHYPSYSDIELVHKKLPLIFGPSPPFAGAYVRTVETETEMGQEPDAQREKPWAYTTTLLTSRTESQANNDKREALQMRRVQLYEQIDDERDHRAAVEGVLLG